MKAYEEQILEHHVEAIAHNKRQIMDRWNHRRALGNWIRINVYLIRMHQWAFDDLRQKIAGRDG